MSLTSRGAPPDSSDAGTAGPGPHEPTGCGSALHSGGPFSAGELQALRIDGLLTHIYADTYVPAGTRVGEEFRAAAIGRTVPRALRTKSAIGRLSAAWIYGCACPPSTTCLLSDRRRRTTVIRPGCAVCVHEVILPRADLVVVAGIPVTTPLRTAVDICLYASLQECLEAVARLTESTALNCPLGAVADALGGMGRVPGKLDALNRINLLRRSA